MPLGSSGLACRNKLASAAACESRRLLCAAVAVCLPPSSPPSLPPSLLLSSQTGKTLAFLLPVVEALYRQRWGKLDGLGALIISPTRELAMQARLLALWSSLMLELGPPCCRGNSQ